MARVRVVEPPATECRLPDDLDVELVPTTTRPGVGETQIVHLGNNPYHKWLVDRCADAVVVVHDVVLHHLLVEVHGAGGLLADKLYEVHGEPGRALAEARDFGLHGRLDPFLFPATAAFVGQARGVVSHSEWGCRVVETAAPGKPVVKLGLPAADPWPVDREAVRSRLGVPPEQTVIMHLGFLTREKGIDAVIGGLATALDAGANARLVLVGEEDSRSPLREAADSLGLASRITITGWLPWHEMIGVPAAADLGVALRAPSAGETSAAVVRFLAAGTPVAVNGSRQFLEWPPEAAPRITPGPSAHAEVARRILAPPGNEARRAARRTYEQSHKPGPNAAALIAFLKQL